MDSDAEMPSAGPSCGAGGKVCDAWFIYLLLIYFLKGLWEEEVRGEEVERGSAVGLGHRGGQLRHLQEPHHGPVHRVPGQPGGEQ